MRWKRRTSIGLAVATMVGAGCETFYPPVSFVNPKNRFDENQPMGVLHSNSNRRFVYVVRRNPAETGAATKPSVFVFAEPPPDTALASAVKAAAELPQGVKANVEVAQQLVDLTSRTQTIVLLRDSMFRLIEARANGVIDDATYSDLFQFTFGAIQDLSSGAPAVRKATAKGVENLTAAVEKATSPANAGTTTRPVADQKLIDSLNQSIQALKSVDMAPLRRGGDVIGPK